MALEKEKDSTDFKKTITSQVRFNKSIIDLKLPLANKSANVNLREDHKNLNKKRKCL